MFIPMSYYSEKDLQNIDEIHNFLTENNIEYSTEYDNFCLNFGNPDGKRSYEIEYIPSLAFPISYPKFNIDGVSRNFFFEKSYKAEHIDNSFISWVKDYEWNNPRKREVLKSYFLHAAGKTPYRIYARDCEVYEVPSKEARLFESEHCFYGKRGASLNLGLYTKKEKYNIPKGTLIMIYTFGKNFFGKNDNIEVLRVGTKKFHQVIGGSSKLLKYFIRNYPLLKIGKKNYKTKKIVFYSDYDHNIGNSMDSLNFKFINYSTGGFMNYWVETGKVKHRQPSKHKEIMKLMSEGKIIAVPNAGVKTFVMEIDRPESEYESNIISKW